MNKTNIIIASLVSALFLGIASCTKDEDPCVEKTWYQDADFDGLGSKTVTKMACEAPAGFVDNSNDDNDDGSSVVPNKGFSSPKTYSGMTLLWSDEFDGTSLNENTWNYELGNNGGWGNNELQNYTKENTSVKDGYLVIQAKRESLGGFNYTSSRLTTEGKFDFKYGRIDIRAALPKGQGMWPALWMLGKNFKTVGWPKCGEIDIMEIVGGQGRDNETHGTVHWDNSGSYASYGGSFKSTSISLSEEFNVYSIVWDKNKISWLFNDKEFHVIDTTPAGLSEFQENFFLIFNVAVGGNWPGSPDGSTLFPQQMTVDYIRVFQ